RMTRQRQQLAHDLRIRLAIEAVAVDRARGAHFIDHGAVNRAPACASGPEEGSVYVEKDKSHGRKIGGLAVRRLVKPLNRLTAQPPRPYIRLTPTRLSRK